MFFKDNSTTYYSSTNKPPYTTPKAAVITGLDSTMKTTSTDKDISIIYLGDDVTVSGSVTTLGDLISAINRGNGYFMAILRTSNTMTFLYPTTAVPTAPNLQFAAFGNPTLNSSSQITVYYVI